MRMHCCRTEAGRGRGPGRRARGKWRRRLRRTGRVGAAGWRWMQQVTGPAGTASGDCLQGASRPPSWTLEGVRRAGGASHPGITCRRDVWDGLCHLPGGMWAPNSHRCSFPHPLVVPSVMASGVTGSVSVALHPLVILNISDHWIRMRSQEGRPVQGEC